MSASTVAASSSKREGLFRQLTSMSRPFWMVNIMEILERLAYYGVRVVIPIYIAQADEIGGLHFSQSDKGIIFLWWAIFQSLTPMFSGQSAALLAHGGLHRRLLSRRPAPWERYAARFGRRLGFRGALRPRKLIFMGTSLSPPGPPGLPAGERLPACHRHIDEGR